MQATEQVISESSPRVHHRGKVLRWIVVVVVAGAGLAYGWHAWTERSQRPLRTFRDTISAVERGDLRNVDEAIEFLEIQHGYASHTRVLRGAVLARRGRYSEAMLELKSVKLEGEFRSPGLFWAGHCLFQMGRLAEAERAYRILLQDFPDHVEAHRRLAAIYHDMGAMDAAQSELQHVIRLDPDDYRAHYLSGTIYHRDRRAFPEAAEAYRLAIEKNPPDSEREQIASDLAETLVALRSYKEARRTLKGFAGARALALHAQCDWNLDRPDSARRLLNSALRKNPDLQSALVFQAKIHINDRHPERAIEPLQRVLKADPHDYSTRQLLIQVYKRTGNAAAVESESARMKTSEMLCTRLQTLYRRAMKDAGDAEVRDAIAKVCEQLGRRRLALIWKQAAEIARGR